MKFLSFLLPLLLFQYNRRRQLESQAQTWMMIGYFIGGLVLTRIISGVIALLLGFTLMRGKRVLAVATAHAATFVICAVGLWAMLSKPRASFGVPTSQGSMTYTESGEYPFINLFVYLVCILIWFAVDFAIAKIFDKRAQAKAAVPTGKIIFGTRKKIAPDTSGNFHA